MPAFSLSRSPAAGDLPRTGIETCSAILPEFMLSCAVTAEWGSRNYLRAHFADKIAWKQSPGPFRTFWARLLHSLPGLCFRLLSCSVTGLLPATGICHLDRGITKPRRTPAVSSPQIPQQAVDGNWSRRPACCNDCYPVRLRAPSVVIRPFAVCEWITKLQRDGPTLCKTPAERPSMAIGAGDRRPAETRCCCDQTLTGPADRTAPGFLFYILFIYPYLSVIHPFLSVPASAYGSIHNTSTHTDRSTAPPVPASALPFLSTSGSDPRYCH